MSKKSINLIKVDEMEKFEILSPTIEAKNAKGDVIFRMKRKGSEENPLYYLFELHLEKCSTDTEKQQVQANFNLITYFAKNLGIPLLDSGEIARKVMEAKPPTASGVTIDVFNYANEKHMCLALKIRKKEK